MQYTRNSDLTYYESHRMNTNCGSYALRLNEWYYLDDRFEDEMGIDIEEWAYEEGKKGVSDEELTNVYGEVLLKCLLEDFEGELEICDGALPKLDNVELIAFNTFCSYNEKRLCPVDSDFHFKVFRDGIWKEKCGWGKVKECDEFSWGIYTGEVVYLYHKLKEN